MDYAITIYHDTRRKLKNDLYPVKLRVYSTSLKKAKLYSTNFALTEKEFHSTWETIKPRKEYQETRDEMESARKEATDVAKLISPFTFEQFEKKLFRGVGEGQNVFYHYGLMIAKNKRTGSLSNAEIYELSQKSIKAYLKYKTGNEPDQLNFAEVNEGWLLDYQDYMLSTINRSRTTLSIYLRSLRAVFNEAIEEKEISSDIYPFGKKRYKVPKVKNVKKALTADQLKKLFNAKPENEYQEKARAFWFFSYSCNGMNIKDIAELKWGALDGDTIVYYRAKTINTAEVIKPIIVYLNDYTISVIEKYCNDDTYPDNYIFPIISKSQSKVDQRRAIKNFTRLINQHLKKLASALELPEEISTYWARHSFATNAIRKGASMEFVSEAFNHGDLSTTKNYFAGFEEETKRELSKNLMNF